MSDILNLAQRTKVMECALTLEKGITEILFLCFNLENSTNLNAFGNKSSNISFQNKIDILKDIGVLNTTEDDDSYTPFEAIMQFRNKFLHIHECNSFMEAYNFIGHSYKLKKYLSDKKATPTEKLLEDTFDTVFQNCNVIIKKKINMIDENDFIRKEKMNTLVSGLKYYISNGEKHNQKLISVVDEITHWNYDVKEHLKAMIEHSYITNLTALILLYDNFTDDNVANEYLDLINNPVYKKIKDSFTQ
jgi:hypothetical protein